jgi:hypothetical protein
MQTLAFLKRANQQYSNCPSLLQPELAPIQLVTLLNSFSITIIGNMPSIELENLDRDGITTAVSSARASIDPAGEDGAIRTSLSQSLSQPQQRRRQQPQHVNSSEHRTGTVAGEASPLSQQPSHQDQEESETGSTSQGQQQVSAQTDHQAADKAWLHRVATQTLDLVKVVWKKCIKQRQAEIAVVALIIGILMISPSFGQYAQSLWSNAVTYQSWCKDEQVRMLS